MNSKATNSSPTYIRHDLWYVSWRILYIYYICTVDVSKWSNKSHFERFPPILNGSKKIWPPLSKELQPNFEGSPAKEGWIHLCPLTVILQLLSVQHANDFNTLGVFGEPHLWRREMIQRKRPYFEHTFRLNLKCPCYVSIWKYIPLEG